MRFTCYEITPTVKLTARGRLTTLQQAHCPIIHMSNLGLPSQTQNLISYCIDLYFYISTMLTINLIVIVFYFCENVFLQFNSCLSQFYVLPPCLYFSFHKYLYTAGSNPWQQVHMFINPVLNFTRVVWPIHPPWPILYRTHQ
jgi:SCAMP family.